jgi:hypothetical protein
MNTQQWTQVVEANYDLIKNELAECLSDTTHIAQRLPKLIIACEYFRLLRGEAFHSQRPPALSFSNGKTAYQMEDELAQLLSEVAATADHSDPALKYHLQEMAKLFTDF